MQAVQQRHDVCEFLYSGKKHSAQKEPNARKTTHARYSIHTPDTGRGGMGMETGIGRGDTKCQTNIRKL